MARYGKHPLDNIQTSASSELRREDNRRVGLKGSAFWSDTRNDTQTAHIVNREQARDAEDSYHL